MVVAAIENDHNRGMSSQVKCECGYVARAESDDEVVAAIREHIRSDHPELMERVSDEDIRSWVEIVA
jgi:predicted small metal-binding protein